MGEVFGYLFLTGVFSFLLYCAFGSRLRRSRIVRRFVRRIEVDRTVDQVAKGAY